MNILENIYRQYYHNQDIPIRELRIKACRKLANESNMRDQSALDVCREQLRPSIDGTEQFDGLVSAWLKHNDMRIMSIALDHSHSSRDKEHVNIFFQKFARLPSQTPQNNPGVIPEAAIPLESSYQKLAELIKEEEKNWIDSNKFDTSSIEDSRERIALSIVRRRGQPDFRKTLIDIYESKCAISGVNAIEALEAAHIIPYRGLDTNHPSNGILLRADLHILFDLGLICINTETMTIIVSEKLSNSIYVEFHGKPLRLPINTSCWPSVEALKKHRQEAGL